MRAGRESAWHNSGFAYARQVGATCATGCAAGRDDLRYGDCGVEAGAAHDRSRAAPHRRAGRPNPPPRRNAALLAQQRAARCRRESRPCAAQSRVTCQRFRRAAAFATCSLAAWRARDARIHAAASQIGTVEEYRRATGESALVELRKMSRRGTARCARGRWHRPALAQLAQPRAQRLRRHLAAVGRRTQPRALALRARSVLKRGAPIGRTASIQIPGCGKHCRGEQDGGRDHGVAGAALADTTNSPCIALRCRSLNISWRSTPANRPQRTRLARHLGPWKQRGSRSTWLALPRCRDSTRCNTKFLHHMFVAFALERPGDRTHLGCLCEQRIGKLNPHHPEIHELAALVANERSGKRLRGSAGVAKEQAC